MKKSLLLIFILLSFIGFSQKKPLLLLMPDTMTSFGISLPKGTIVVAEDVHFIYQLTAYTEGTKSIQTADKVKLSGGSTAINNLNAWSDTLFLRKYTWHTSSSAQGISNEDSTFVYYYKCSSTATAYKISKLITGNLICWYNSTTLKKGFISYAVNSSDTLKLVIYGARYAAGDRTFRISTTEKIKIWEYFVPGELLADSMSDIGIQHVQRYGDSLVLIGLSAYLQVPAAGDGAACIFGVYSNSYNQTSTLATKLTTNSYTSFGTSDLLNNIITPQNTIPGGSRITIRIINSAGATNKANTMNIMVYYCSKSIFDSL